jgi:MFS family permease
MPDTQSLPGLAAAPDVNAGRVARLTFYFGLAYFCQGISQTVLLLNQPLRYYLREGVGYDADAVSRFLFVVSFPWVIKPLYGLLSDFVPLFGYRRKSYLLLMNLLAASAFLYLTGVRRVEHVLFALTLTAIGVAAADVIVDALMVESGQETGRVRRFQGVQWLCLNVAGIGSGFLGGWICSKYSPTGALRLACLISAVPPIVVAGMTLWAVRERRTAMDLPQLRETAGGLVAALKSLPLWAVLGFLVLINLNPGLQTPMYKHLEERFGLKEDFQGQADGVGAIGYTVGSVIFLLTMSGRLSVRASVAIGLGAMAACSVPYFFIAGKTSALVAYGVYGVGYMIATLSTLSLAALACPRRAEGFVFAAMTAIMNFSIQGGDVVGSTLYVGYLGRDIRPLIALSITLTLLGLAILPFLRTRSERGASPADDLPGGPGRP